VQWRGMRPDTWEGATGMRQDYKSINEHSGIRMDEKKRQLYVPEPVTGLG